MLQVQRGLASVVVVCANSRADLPACLASLKVQSHPQVEVIVIDNGSTDGTREYVEAEHPWVRFHSEDANLGYGKANNAGFALASGEYLIVLNPDTEVDHGFVSGLVRAIATDGAGLATSLICLFDRRDVINACGNDVHLSGVAYCRGLGEPAAGYTACSRVASISGCAFAIRRDVLRRIGGFDDDYFLYVEDTDLSIRANIAGERIVFAPESVVFHKYALKMTADKFHLLERNRRQTLIKNLRWATLLALMPTILLTGALMWVYAIVRGPAYVGAKVRAHWWIYSNWRHLMAKRRAVQALRAAPDSEVVRLLSNQLPSNQVIGTGLFADWAGRFLNVVYRVLAVPSRLVA